MFIDREIPPEWKNTQYKDVEESTHTKYKTCVDFAIKHGLDSIALPVLYRKQTPFRRNSINRHDIYLAFICLYIAIDITKQMKLVDSFHIIICLMYSDENGIEEIELKRNWAICMEQFIEQIQPLFISSTSPRQFEDLVNAIKRVKMLQS